MIGIVPADTGKVMDNAPTVLQPFLWYDLIRGQPPFRIMETEPNNDIDALAVRIDGWWKATPV